jgi:hypothetical protein
MIKITTQTYAGGVKLAEPKTAYIWLNAKEIGANKIGILATVHHTAEDAKAKQEKNTDQLLSVNLMIPPQEVQFDFDFTKEGNFRQLHHEAFLTELLKVNKDITLITNRKIINVNRREK